MSMALATWLPARIDPEIVPPEVAAWATWQRAQGYAETTIRVRVAVVIAVASAADVDPAELSESDVVAYLDRDLSVSTRAKYLQHLAAWAAWRKIPDPTARLKRPKPPRRAPDPFSEPELARMIAAADALTRVWLMLGAWAGLRASEIARVRGQDVDLAGASLRVRGKGGRIDQQPLPPVLLRELAPWVREHGAGPLWTGDGLRVSRRVHRLALRCGVPAARAHRLRHRYGTVVYATSQDLLETQRLMRHSSPQTTVGYVALASDGPSAIVNSLPGAS